MNKHLVAASHRAYRGFVKPVLFRFDAEKVHGAMTVLGQKMMEIQPLARFAEKTTSVSDPRLVQAVAGIGFQNPIGLSAGFDYEARLTRVLPALGFGFGTVGTITNKPFAGNPAPRLGRLPKSRSLLVNKGFKNPGIAAILSRLAGKSFAVPVGVSIGVTNSRDIRTPEAAVADIAAAFRAAEKSAVPFSYYELNVSCPNLETPIEFYAPARFEALLSAIQAIGLTRPLFVKMPIDRSDEETAALLDLAVEYRAAGVIFGNLQKNRLDPAFDAEEIRRAPKGNFSGKPTFRRSNELIRLAWKRVGNKLAIIGAGGVFSAEDAYAKIKAGASLVELITGMIYEGPQLPAEINAGLVRLLERDGFAHISEAVGSEA